MEIHGCGPVDSTNPDVVAVCYYSNTQMVMVIGSMAFSSYVDLPLTPNGHVTGTGTEII